MQSPPLQNPQYLKQPSLPAKQPPPKQGNQEQQQGQLTVILITNPTIGLADTEEKKETTSYKYQKAKTNLHRRQHTPSS